MDSFTPPDHAASDTANFHLLPLNLQTLSKVLHKLGQLVRKAGLITSFFFRGDMQPGSAQPYWTSVELYYMPML